MSTWRTCSLLILCLTIAAGCGQRVTHEEHTHDHGHSHMIEHIAEGHGIQIGSETNADIVVTRGSNTVSVVFTEHLLEKIPGDCLPVLRFSGPKKEMTEQELGQFLNDLHDYLMLTYGEGKGPVMTSKP